MQSISAKTHIISRLNGSRSHRLRLSSLALPEAPFDASLSEPLVSQFASRPVFFHVKESLKTAAKRLIVSGATAGPVLDVS